jgi:hypothetical protein
MRIPNIKTTVIKANQGDSRIFFIVLFYTEKLLPHPQVDFAFGFDIIN